MSVTAPRPSASQPRRPRRGGPYRWRAEQSRPAHQAPGTERERVGALTRAIGMAAVEVLSGARPASQLSRWASPEIVERMRRRAALLTQRRALEPQGAPVHAIHRHAEILRQRVCPVAEGVYEVALVIRDDSRTRAMVMRAERPGAAWIITVLEVG